MWTDPDSLDAFDDEMRLGHDIRWQRTGIRNAAGQMILKRIDMPIGFRARHDGIPTYAVEDGDDG